MGKTVIVKKPADFKRVQEIFEKGVMKPFKDTRSMFLLLGAMIDRDTQLTFKAEGAYRDRPKWKKFSKKTLQTPRGTWNIRYGTDKKPKRTAAQLAQYKTDNNLWYKPGPMKGYRSDRRYSSSSKLLQASGMFKQSFRIININRTRMRYGTNMRLASKIMSNPERQVLHYTEQDEKRYTRLVVNWVNRKIKF